jgi:antitoxin component YwqK of YwqJK toxin-antitoxin module
MKKLLGLLLFLTVTLGVYAQNDNTPPRHIRLRNIGKDSINLSFNEYYALIEDSCADIIRYGHLNIKDRKFMGAFKDVSALDTSIVLLEGNYTPDGLKNGLFTAHYINGSLRSKGYFKNNKLDGHWETYYENEKPAMVFEAQNGIVRIIDSWDAEGKKVIENGKGAYQVNLGKVSSKGKLENGLPDGTWHSFKTDDAAQIDLAEESFKKGIFQKGTSLMGAYTDTSRIVLFNIESLPYVHAEKLLTSSVPCNGVRRKHIVRAQYAGGRAAFSQYINQAVLPVIRRFNIKNTIGKLVFDGEVSEIGIIGHITSRVAFDGNMARQIMDELHKLPALQPATADGKPVVEKFIITFTFQLGRFKFGYQFLPITQQDVQ